MGLPFKAIRKYREHGFVTLAKEVVISLSWRLPLVYQHIRPTLPAIGYLRWNGVRVARPRKLLDPVLPARWLPELSDHSPRYETALVAAIQREVQPGDSVVIVGGGYGVTVVTAARAVGANGTIVCFEAVGERVADIAKAIRLNSVAAPVQVNHAIVGQAISLFGDQRDAQVISPADIPVCDVLELDCEGAELEILAGLRIRPRRIIVETHGLFGAPTGEVLRLLREMSYVVEDMGAAEASVEQFCLDNDICVLVARLATAGAGPTDGGNS